MAENPFQGETIQTRTPVISEALEQAIWNAVGGPASGLVDVVVKRVATAAADGMISRSELRDLLGYIAAKRHDRTIQKPGAYFVTCAKRMFLQSGIPWSTA